MKQHTHGRMEDTGEGSLRVTTDHVAPPSVSSKNLARVLSAVTDTFYLLCCLIPTARDTETQRGLVTNLRTQPAPGRKTGRKPTARALSCDVPRLPTSRRVGGEGDRTTRQGSGPNSGAKDGLVRFQRNPDSGTGLAGPPLLAGRGGCGSGPNEK